jgi:hypothetical protein
MPAATLPIRCRRPRFKVAICDLETCDQASPQLDFLFTADRSACKQGCVGRHIQREDE